MQLRFHVLQQPPLPDSSALLQWATYPCECHSATTKGRIGMCRYRNKVAFGLHFPKKPRGAAASAPAQLGLRKPRSHEVLPLTTCHLISKEMQYVMISINRALAQLPAELVARDEDRNKGGLISGITLLEGAESVTKARGGRRASVSDEPAILVDVQVQGTGRSRKARKAIVNPHIRQALAKNPAVVGITMSIQGALKKSNVLEAIEVIVGQNHVWLQIGHIVLKRPTNVFAQVNTKQCELLYNVIGQLAELRSTDVLVDLYCGIGSISLFLASSATECSQLSQLSHRFWKQNTMLPPTTSAM